MPIPKWCVGRAPCCCGSVCPYAAPAQYYCTRKQRYFTYDAESGAYAPYDPPPGSAQASAGAPSSAAADAAATTTTTATATALPPGAGVAAAAQVAAAVSASSGKDASKQKKPLSFGLKVGWSLLARGLRACAAHARLVAAGRDGECAARGSDRAAERQQVDDRAEADPLGGQRAGRGRQRVGAG